MEIKLAMKLQRQVQQTTKETNDYNFSYIDLLSNTFVVHTILQIQKIRCKKVKLKGGTESVNNTQSRPVGGWKRGLYF